MCTHVVFRIVYCDIKYVSYSGLLPEDLKNPSQRKPCTRGRRNESGGVAGGAVRAGQELGAPEVSIQSRLDKEIVGCA